MKITNWNIKAGPDKWEKFERQIRETTQQATQIITDTSIDLKRRYKKWYALLENTARNTIGKTTIKGAKPIAVSTNLRCLNQEKKAIKKKIMTNNSIKFRSKIYYNTLQHVIVYFW